MKSSGLNDASYVRFVVENLRKATQGMIEPSISQLIRVYGRDPYLILISCILSLRTKDAVSLAASYRLFEVAQTPAQMIALKPRAIEKRVYPTGFYRVKARTILAISHELIEKFQEKVPADEGALLSLPGVGRKTAALVLGQAFHIPALCVDTHVHQVANRLGLVSTTTPEQTEEALKKVVPRDLWIEMSRLLVTWGQHVCVPVSPWCSKCVLATKCPRVGVKRAR